MTVDELLQKLGEKLRRPLETYAKVLQDNWINDLSDLKSLSSSEWDSLVIVGIPIMLVREIKAYLWPVKDIIPIKKDQFIQVAIKNKQKNDYGPARALPPGFQNQNKGQPEKLAAKISEILQGEFGEQFNIICEFQQQTVICFNDFANLEAKVEIKARACSLAEDQIKKMFDQVCMACTKYLQVEYFKVLVILDVDSQDKIIYNPNNFKEPKTLQTFLGSQNCIASVSSFLLLKTMLKMSEINKKFYEVYMPQVFNTNNIYPEAIFVQKGDFDSKLIDEHMFTLLRKIH